MANEKKYLDFAALGYYDEKLKAWVAAADEAMLASANKYADDLATNYDAAGTAQSKMEELANGQVKTNMDAIAKLNGDANTEGSVAKAVADSAATLTEAINAVDEKADAAQAAADKAQGEVDVVEGNIGNVDGLSTENKTVVGAINEVLAAVGAGGTAAAVTMTSDTTTEGALKSYTIKQGTTTVGTIDIPKDMVVEAGEVVTLADGDIEGYAAGTYIKLVLANVTEPLYINVGTLVDIYKAQEGAAQVQLVINSSTREISASIVAGSIGSTEIADNAIVTAKIADANVTKAKLSTAVQASLDRADAAATKAAFDEEVERAKAAEAQALTDAKAYADEAVAAEKQRAEGIEGGLEERLAAVEANFGDGEGTVEAQIAAAVKTVQDEVDALEEAHATDKKALEDADTDIKGRLDALEADIHTHENKELLDTYTQTEANLADAVAKKHAHENAAVLDGITAEKVSAWDASEQNAKDHADGLNTAMDARVQNLEGKVGEGFVAITNAEIDTLFAEAEA